MDDPNGDPGIKVEWSTTTSIGPRGDKTIRDEKKASISPQTIRVFATVGVVVALSCVAAATFAVAINPDLPKILPQTQREKQ